MNDTVKNISENNPHQPRIAIIGAGISGLAAANRVLELSPQALVTLYERRDRVGGVIHTDFIQNYEIECSADNFITTVPWALDLCKRLGLESDLVTPTPLHRHTFVVLHGRLNKLPDGFMMMAPTRMWPMAITRLLSPWGKLRAALEYFIPPKKDDADESMEQFACRRLGRESFLHLIEPLVSGVYAADMSKLSVLATLPRFREMEKTHGSLIRAMRAQMWENRKKNHLNTKTTESGPRYSMFVTVRGGLIRLTESLAARLPNDSIRLNTSTVFIKPLNDNQWEIISAVHGDAHHTFSDTYDAVILATESHKAAQLLSHSANLSAIDQTMSQISTKLSKIEHTGTAIMTVAFRRDQIAHPLDGMGAVVAGVEKSPILALSFSSEKYPHRAPDGYVLLRIFAGGARAPEMASMDDNMLQAMLLDETRRILRITGEPCMVSISHWPNTMPQYHLGHLELVDEIENLAQKIPSLALAGNAFHGVGIPHCIHSGEMAAEKIIRNFHDINR